MCAREKEREKERGKEREKERESEELFPIKSLVWGHKINSCNLLATYQSSIKEKC
jgi:hypothetical protein